MGLFSKFFGGDKEAAKPAEDPLVPTPIPALGEILWMLEQQKGSALTREEVLQARDTAVCIMLPLSKKEALDERRGFRDIDPENCWEEWLIVRAGLQAQNPDA